MWIVQLALRRPYTFIVLALLILIIGPLAILRTPTDIFPNINIPVVSTIWRYTGLSTEEMEGRSVTNYERAMSATVNDIARIESQTYNGIGVVKVFFPPTANLPASLAQIIAIAEPLIGGYPQGTVAPLILTYNASTVPILQLSLSSKSLGEHEIFDLANSFMRTQLATVQGAVMPYRYGGKFRSVMVDIDSRKLQSKNLSPLDVVNAVNAQNLVLPTGTAKIGEFEYNIGMNGSPKTIAELNDLPIKTGPGGTIYIRAAAQVHDGFQPQTNIVRHDGQRAVLVNILKYGTASTLDIVDRVKAELPKMAAGLPPDLTIKIATDQSIFVRAAVDGVIYEAILAGCLTALMILLFLGSWRSTLIIAVTIPLAILTSIIALFALGETINIMTLGGLALAVGILVDDATVAIENITQHLEQGKPLDEAILDGAQQIAIPTFVSALAIWIVFVPMSLPPGVARYPFVPMAEAVVFAMLASYVFSRTLVPTLAKYLLRAGLLDEHGHPKASRNPFVRFHRAFERGFEGFRDNYHGILERCMRHQKFFMIVFLAACIASGGLLPFVGRDFLTLALPAPIAGHGAGRNIEANRAFSLGVSQKPKQVDGLEVFRLQQPADQPRLDINVDRTRAQQAGFSQKDVASNLLIALSGSFQTSPAFWLNPKNGVTYNIITQTPQYNVDSLQALANIPISGPDSTRSSILGDLATVSRGAERAVSSHWNVQPVLDIFGATQDRDLGGVADDVNRIVDASMKDLPKGSRLIVRGQIETMLSSFQGLLYGLIFAIVMVYLLMVVNFQSWLDPFIIITALPAALAGIVWMLFATGTTVSVPALTGAIMAMGIATANSILVVSFARERLQTGVDSVTAALDAGFSRFRPVLMTALAMIIGMVPMSLGLGEGGEQNAPLGRAVIGGLLLATLATLIFVPVVFAFIHGFIGRRRDAAASRQSPQPA